MKKTYILLVILAILLISLPVRANTEIAIPYAEVKVNIQPNVIEYDLSSSYITYTTMEDNLYTLYLYNLLNNSTKIIAEQEGSKFEPSIDGNNLVYVEAQKHIMLYNIDLNIETEELTIKRITKNTGPHNNNHPHVQGDKISYTQWFTSVDQSSCQVYDIETEISVSCENIIGQNQTNQYHNNNIVVWQDTRNEINEIFLHDFNTNEIKNLSNNGLNHYFPKIYNDTVIWDTKNQIYIKNLVDNSLQIIHDDHAAIFSSDIDGQNIVYQSNPTGNYDIYLYNIVTKDKVPVTFSTAEDKAPKIDGHNILWLRKGANNKYDLYYKDIKAYADKLLTKLKFETITSTSVNISWPEIELTDNYYTLYRSTSIGSLGEIVADHIKDSSYQDNTITAGKLYYYTLRLVDIDGNKSILTEQYLYHSADRKLVRTNTRSTVYLIDHNQAYLISNADIFNSHDFSWLEINIISNIELDQYHYAGPLKYPEGSLIQSNSMTVYQVENGTIRAFINGSVFEEQGHQWNQIHYVSQNHMKLYTEGETITP